MTWGSLAGVTNLVHRKTALGDGWTTVTSGSVLTTGACARFSEPATGAAGFYRVVYQP